MGVKGQWGQAFRTLKGAGTLDPGSEDGCQEGIVLELWPQVSWLEAAGWGLEMV